MSLKEVHQQREFRKTRDNISKKKLLQEISEIYDLIDNNPTPEIIDDIIFNHKTHHLLIKHDALIKAIELGYIGVIHKVVLFSPSIDLVKTALNYVNDDYLLKIIVLGANVNIPQTRKSEIQNLALMQIKDDNIFGETFREGYTIIDYQRLFKKIKHKSKFKVMSKFYKRIIPLIITLMPNNEVINEFSRNDKYPKIVTDLIPN